MSAVEEGLDGPLDYFAFKQPAAEFKLKVDFPLAAWDGGSAPKSSLLRICQRLSLAFFPVGDKGALGYVSIDGLADREELGSVNVFSFPTDESHILAMALAADESALFVAKGSQTVYRLAVSASNSAVIANQAQMAKAAVDVACIGSSLAVLFEEGDVRLYSAELEPKDTQPLPGPFSCIASKGSFVAAGYRESLKVDVLNVGAGSMHSISFPESVSGSGIGSLSMVSEDTFLCSITPVDTDTDDFDLFLVEQFSESPSFTRLIDPCAARPPRANQFFFEHMSDFSAERKDLADFVVLSNNASPDVGIAGRMDCEEAFQTFFIDNDEGLAQLPLQQGELTFPLGLALDFTSRKPIPDPSDREPLGAFPPAPVLWILTSAGHLCPFMMLKTNEKPPKWPFMLNEVEIAGSDADDSAALEEELSAALQSVPSDVTRSTLSDEEEDEVSELPVTLAGNSKDSVSEIEKEDGTVVVEKPRVFEAVKPASPAPKAMSSPSIASGSPMSTTSVIASDTGALKAHEHSQPKPLSKENIDLGPYKNILLEELAVAHESMRADIDQLKELADRSGKHLHQTTGTFFSKLEPLEAYANVIERLLATSEKAFGGLTQRTRDARGQLEHLAEEVRQIRATWRRIKLDRRINWNEKRLTLQHSVSEIVEKIEELSTLFSMPSPAALSATAKTLYREIVGNMQALMAFLSVLFVLPETMRPEESLAHDSAVVSLRELTLSTDSLLTRIGSLSLGQASQSKQNLDPLKKIRQMAVLQAAKTRGARVLVPDARPPVLRSVSLQPTVLPVPDEELLERLAKSLSIVEDVPKFEALSIAATVGAKPAAAPSPLATMASLPSALSKEEIAKMQLQSQPKPAVVPAKHDAASTKTEPAAAVPRPAFSAAAASATLSLFEQEKTSKSLSPGPIVPLKIASETPKPLAAAKPVEVPSKSQPITEALKAPPEPLFAGFTFARPAETEPTKLDFSSLALGTVPKNTEPATKAIPAIFSASQLGESKQALDVPSSTASPFSFTLQPKSEPIAKPAMQAVPSALPTVSSAAASFSSPSGAPAAIAPSFSFAPPSTVPQFGQTSMPSTLASPAAFGTFKGSSSLAPASGGGFAAFAQQQQQHPPVSFASFGTQPLPSQQQQTQQQGQPASGLSFAAFKPSDPHADQKKPPSSATFSFSGFRE